MYRSKDFSAIKESIYDIEEKANELFMRNYHEPSIKEYQDIIKLLKKIVKKKNRIIYGGYAQNELIKEKNKDDVFYTEIQMPDLEIYSPDPIKDAVDIADELYEKGYFNPKVDSAVHEGTYKIFCNLVNYCDITYMPKNIYNNCPTIKVDGLRLAHPHFMMTDAYRVYSDLITSNYRLSKTFFRMSKLFDHYPLDNELDFVKINYKLSKNNDKIKDFIRKKIIHNSKLIVIGHYAFNYLVKKTNLNNYVIDNYPYYELITSNYEEDVKDIYEKLNKKYKNKVKINGYYPFFTFFDNRTEFMVDNEVVLKLYGNNKRCVPYKASSKKMTNFGTLQTVILYLFMNLNYNFINKNNSETKNYESMIFKIMKARDTYLEDNGLNVLDESPFQEFTYECFGQPHDSMRDSMLEGIKRIEQGKKFKQFTYLPKGKKINIPVVNFDNNSGNLIKKENHKPKIK